MESNHEFASFKVWRGEIQVTFSIPHTDPAAIAMFIDQTLASGFSAQLVGVEVGELVEDIGAVCMALHKSKTDQRVTPRIALYSTAQNKKHKVVDCYLNNSDDIAAFEGVTGLKLDALPKLPVLGRSPQYPDRGSEGESYIVAVHQPARVIYKPNPLYDPNETDVEKKKPKYLFVRWHSVAPTAPHTEQQPGNDKPATPKGTPKLTGMQHTWTQEEAKAFTAHWKAQGYGGIILRVLGIDRMGECKLPIADANALMQKYVADMILNEAEASQQAEQDADEQDALNQLEDAAGLKFRLTRPRPL